MSVMAVSSSVFDIRAGVAKLILLMYFVTNRNNDVKLKFHNRSSWTLEATNVGGTPQIQPEKMYN